MPQMDEYDTSAMPPMSKVALGNIKRTAEVIAKLQEQVEARSRPTQKADSDAWRRSKNKKYLKKMQKQRERRGG